MRQLKGYYNDPATMNGWNLGAKGRPSAPTWVLDQYGVRCIVTNGIMDKWSRAGTMCVAWHPRPVTDRDYLEYDPPTAPVGIEPVWDDDEPQE